MQCPNDDPYFTRMMYRMKLLKKGMKAGEIVNVRRNTFYFICVVVRLSIIGIVFMLKNSLIVRSLVLLGCIVAISNFWSGPGSSSYSPCSGSTKFYQKTGIVISGSSSISPAPTPVSGSLTVSMTLLGYVILFISIVAPLFY
jgi:hypothetical protein